MPKQFYTEHDIKDLADRGVKVLEVNDDVVVTDLGRDLALKLGLRLNRAETAKTDNATRAEITRRVKADVIARLGDQVDMKLLDAVVAKVVNNLK